MVRSTLRKKVKELSKDDKISELPDVILCHILSFLPTINAIATSVLSWRFVDLWKNISKLTFDDTLQPFSCGTRKHPKYKNVMFANFVNRVLLLHNPHYIEELSLELYENSKPYDVSIWISNAVMKRIRSLNISVIVNSSTLVQLPSNLFKCETLEVLRFRGHVLINVPSFCCLPNLRTMELDRVRFQDNESARKLISSCTSLEVLDVDRFSYVNVSVFTIYSSTLQDVKFIVHDCKGINECKLEIVSPALRKLHVANYSGKNIVLPSEVLVCETLEVLVLQGQVVIGAARIICLSSLRILKLLQFDYDDSKTINELISSCSCIESLVIKKVQSEIELNISSSTLKDLDIFFSSFANLTHKLVINVPALQYLSVRLCGPGSVDYDIENLSSLEEANIVIEGRLGSTCGYQSGDLGNACSHHSGDFSNIYQSLENVKILTISPGTSKVLVYEHAFPMFLKLTVLDVKCGWDILQEFIKNSTRLEELKFTLKYSRWDDHDIHWRNPTSVPACFLSSLKRMSILDFQGSEDELAMMKYILENARIMRKMKIHFHYSLGSKTKAGLRNKLLNFHRGREKCKVIAN